IAHKQPGLLAERLRVADSAGSVGVNLWGGPGQPEDHFSISTDQQVYSNPRGEQLVAGAAVRDGVLWPLAAEGALAATHPDGYEGLNRGGDMTDIARTMERFTGSAAKVVADRRLGLQPDMNDLIH